MTRHKLLNIALSAIAALSPFFLFIGGIGMMMREGTPDHWWERILWILGPSIFWGAGPLGFFSALTLMIINRKRLKSFWCWFGLVFLLLINFLFNAVTLASASWFSRHYLEPCKLEFRPPLSDTSPERLRKMNDDDWNVIYNTRRSMHLKFDHADVTNEDIERLGGNAYIKSIIFDSCPNITDDIVRSLVRVPNLEKIGFISNPQLKNPDFSLLALLKGLKTLYLTDNRNLSTESLRSIAALSDLKDLGFKGCSCLDDAVLSKIATITGLHSLRLVGCEYITDVGIAEILKKCHLKSLSIFACPNVKMYDINGVVKSRRHVTKQGELAPIDNETAPEQLREQ